MSQLQRYAQWYKEIGYTPDEVPRRVAEIMRPTRIAEIVDDKILPARPAPAPAQARPAPAQARPAPAPVAQSTPRYLIKARHARLTDAELLLIGARFCGVKAYERAKHNLQREYDQQRGGKTVAEFLQRHAQTAPDHARPGSPAPAQSARLSDAELLAQGKRFTKRATR